MTENQNIEWKESWRDEYLKWICGFANAQGGKIIIGKDDNGKVVGVSNAKKLMEYIPNKTRDVLGVVIDVNLQIESQLEYIEICVESYPYPVNYLGQYHYRSGSTKQELKGVALNKFMLQKKGKKWDGVPVPNVSIDDLENETFEFFRKRAYKSKRIDEESLSDSNEHLLENLHLKENEYIKRAGVLLFHSNPEIFIVGSYIKIGFFESDSELMYQDEIHGNLFHQIEKTIDLLFSKYIKADISYEGIHRIESYEYPKEAIREALINAISHKDYSSGFPIQISVYKDKLIIWNDGHLPEKWTIKKLIQKHPSKPYNPDVANAFFRSGHIESWGRGTIKIIEKCIEVGLPIPLYHYEGSDFSVEFRKDIYHKEFLQTLNLNDRQVSAILYAKENEKITNSIYQKLNYCSRNTASNDLSELVEKRIFRPSGQKGAGAYYILI